MSQGREPTFLADLRIGDRAEVAAIASADRGRLDRLSAFGLTPGASLTLRQRQPAFVIDLGETELARAYTRALHEED